MESRSNPYASFDPRPYIGKVFDEYDVTLSNNDSILYALSIGFNLNDQLNREHFKFTYENDGDFQTFPTIFQAWATKNFAKFASMPGLPKIDPNMMLHGEDKLEMFKPLKPDGSKYIC